MRETDKTTLMTKLVWLCIRNMTALIWACYIAAWFHVPVEPVLVAGGTFWGGELLGLMIKKLTQDQKQKGKKKEETE